MGHNQTAPSDCPINRLTNDLLVKILWHTVPASKPPREELNSYVVSYHESGRYDGYPTPVETPPPSDVLVSLFNASICQRWRTLAKEYVTELLVENRFGGFYKDLTSIVHGFPNLTRVFVCDHKVDRLDDDFISALSSSLPHLKSLHLGWGYRKTLRDQPSISREGLDVLFQTCTELEELSIIRPARDAELPESFFELRQLQTLLLTDPSALMNPQFKNFSALTTLDLGFPWRHEHISCLSHFSQLARLSLRFEFQNTQSSSSLSLVLPPNLQFLEFGKSCPQFELIFPLGSSFPQLQQLCISGCQQLQHLPEGMGNLLPSLRKFCISWCSALVELPEDFTSLTCLETLEIFGCGALTGLSRNFGELPVLKTLQLGGLSQLTFPDSIAQCTSLQSLIFAGWDGCLVLPRIVCRLTALTLLYILHMNSLELPLDIGALTNLQVLRVSSYNLRPIPASFVQLSSLTKLTFVECDITDLPDGMSQLVNLRELRFTNCSQLEQLPESLISLTRLCSLVFEWVPFYDPFSELHASDFQLTSMPRRLDSLCRLKELEVTGCRLLTEFAESLPQSLEVLSLGNEERETSLPDLSLLSSLRDLRLILPRVENGAALTRSLPQLTRLVLQLQRMGDAVEIPFPLTFPELRVMIILGDYVSWLPEDLGSSVPRLRELEITDIASFAEVPASIRQLQHLTSLGISARFYSPTTSLSESIALLPHLRKRRLSQGSRPPPPAAPDTQPIS